MECAIFVVPNKRDMTITELAQKVLIAKSEEEVLNMLLEFSSQEFSRGYEIGFEDGKVEGYCDGYDNGYGDGVYDAY